MECYSCTWSATAVPGVLQLYPECYSCTWSATAVPGVPQLYLECYGCTWSVTAVPGVAWLYLECHSYTWSATAVPGVLWLYLECYGCTGAETLTGRHTHCQITVCEVTKHSIMTTTPTTTDNPHIQTQIPSTTCLEGILNTMHRWDGNQGDRKAVGYARRRQAVLQPILHQAEVREVSDQKPAHDRNHTPVTQR